MTFIQLYSLFLGCFILIMLLAWLFCHYMEKKTKREADELMMKANQHFNEDIEKLKNLKVELMEGTNDK